MKHIIVLLPLLFFAAACGNKAAKETQKAEPKKVITKTYNTDKGASSTTANANKTQAQIDEEKIQAYVKVNKLKKVQKTASGVHYLIETEGTGASPTLTDKVKVHYRGTLLDGTEFDSSYARNEPISFPLTGVIKGWQDGIPMLKKGGKGKLLIPSELAYGSRNMGKIPSNSVLIFDVELLDILK